MQNLYPRCYEPKPVLEQAEIIQSFTGIKLNYSRLEDIARSPLPVGAESWFVIPKQKGLYFEAMLDLIEKMREKNKLYPHVDLRKKSIVRAERTVKALDLIQRKQDIGDAIVIPAQFGAKHKGQSVENVQKKLAPNEFGLGAYEIGWMLLIHSGRVYKDDQLHIDCPADFYYFPKGKDPNALSYDYQFRWPTLGIRDPKRPSPNFGSVTGFLNV